MCHATSRSAAGSTIRGPRWVVLYTATLAQVAALGLVEGMQSAHAARVALRCLLALGLFATTALWLRVNRPALDLQDWCECAGERMTIRVIEPRVPMLPSALPELPVIPEPAIEEAYEVV
jgi:hypothetical protein